MGKGGAIAIGVLIVGAGGLAMWQLLNPKAERGKSIYFYDQSEEKLYRVAHGTLAPDKGIGGASGDGVEAVVLACPKDDKHVEEMIAYLETFTPEQAEARRREAKTGEPIAGLTREWIAENTLLRRVDDHAWHAASTEQGAAIRSQGIRQRCPVCEEWLKARRPK